MKRLVLALIIGVIFLAMAYSPVFPQDASRAPRKSFFTVNPSLRADVMAQEAMAKEEEFLKWHGGSESLSPDKPSAWDAPSSEQWREIAGSRLTMSLSRMAPDPGHGLGISPIIDDQEVLRDFWSQLLRGSIRGDNIENLGGVLQPQLNLGIEF